MNLSEINVRRRQHGKRPLTQIEYDRLRRDAGSRQSSQTDTDFDEDDFFNTFIAVEIVEEIVESIFDSTTDIDTFSGGGGDFGGGGADGDY